MDIDTSTAPVLLTGGTGTTGRRIAHRLEERGVTLRIASRAGPPPFCWQEPSTWPTMVEGVRSAWSARNFSESFLADAVPTGTVALPVGEVGEPFVDVDDVDAIAVAALADPGHAGEVTGPRLLTFAQVLDGRGAHLTDGVRQALGRPARSFTAHLPAAVASGAWQLAGAR